MAAHYSISAGEMQQEKPTKEPPRLSCTNPIRSDSDRIEWRMTVATRGFRLENDAGLKFSSCCPAPLEAEAESDSFNNII